MEDLENGFRKGQSQDFCYLSYHGEGIILIVTAEKNNDLSALELLSSLLACLKIHSLRSDEDSTTIKMIKNHLSLWREWQEHVSLSIIKEHLPCQKLPFRSMEKELKSCFITPPIFLLGFNEVYKTICQEGPWVNKDVEGGELAKADYETLLRKLFIFVLNKQNRRTGKYSYIDLDSKFYFYDFIVFDQLLSMNQTILKLCFGDMQIRRQFILKLNIVSVVKEIEFRADQTIVSNKLINALNLLICTEEESHLLLQKVIDALSDHETNSVKFLIVGILIGVKAENVNKNEIDKLCTLLFDGFLARSGRIDVFFRKELDLFLQRLIQLPSDPSNHSLLNWLLSHGGTMVGELVKKLGSHLLRAGKIVEDELQETHVSRVCNYYCNLLQSRSSNVLEKLPIHLFGRLEEEKVENFLRLVSEKNQLSSIISKVEEMKKHLRFVLNIVDVIHQKHLSLKHHWFDGIRQRIGSILDAFEDSTIEKLRSDDFFNSLFLSASLQFWVFAQQMIRSCLGTQLISLSYAG